MLCSPAVADHQRFNHAVNAHHTLRLTRCLLLLLLLLHARLLFHSGLVI